MASARRQQTWLRVVTVTAVLLTANALCSLLVAGVYLVRTGSGLEARTTDGTLSDLHSKVVAAAYRATAAEFAGSAPGIAAVAQVPRLGDDITVLRTLSEVAGRVTRFAEGSIQEIATLVPEGSSIAAAFYRNGRLDFDNIEAITGLTKRGEQLLNELNGSMEDLDEPVVGPVIKLLRRARARLTAAERTAASAVELLGALPDLAGRDQPRRYFLAFQGPSEARGSGGIIGVYGILVAADGAIRLAHVGPVLELNKGLQDPVPAPQWFTRHYGDLLASEDFRQVNQALHFPTVAQVLLDMYESSTGEHLDGVMTMDPIVLEQVTAATGPLEGPGWRIEVGKKNARRVLLRDIYLRFGQYRSKEQNRFLNGLIENLLDRIDRGRIDAVAMVDGLAKASKWQHLKVYAEDHSLRSALSRVEVDGDFERAGNNVQAVFHNNFTGSKIDYYLWRDQRTQLELTEEGDAIATTTVSVENRAPTAPSSLLIRPLRRKVPNGHNRMTLNFLLPATAHLQSYREEGKQKTPLQARELRYPVVWNVIDVPSMQERTASVKYRLPDAVDLADERPAFTMTLWPQPLARADTFSFRFVPPPGFTLDPQPRRRLQADGSYVLEGRLFGPKTITAILTPD